jgi:signal transduction histidine kinase
LVGFLIFGALMWFDLALSLARGRDKTLGNRALRLTNLLERTEGDPGGLKDSQFDMFAQATPEGHLIQVFDERSMRIYPTGPQAVHFPWPMEALSDAAYVGQAKFRGRHYRVLGRTLKVNGRTRHLVLAGQLEDNRMTLGRFGEGLLWAFPLVLILSAFAGYFLSRRALDPVDRLIVSARSISIGSLSQRLPVSTTGDELARLADTCNDMLDRLEKAVRQITRFTADASHELRSPLAFIRTVAECALSAPGLDAETVEAFRDIVDETNAASMLLADMLTLARADSGHVDTTFETIDLAALAQDVILKNQPLAIARAQRLAVRVDVPHLLVMGDPAQLRRLLWILTDNAMKYTPGGGMGCGTWMEDLARILFLWHNSERSIGVQKKRGFMPQSVADLEQRRAKLIAEMSRLHDLRPGCITGIIRRCGKPTCHCAKAGDPGHGPTLRLTYKAEGKTISQALPTPAAVQKAEREIGEFRRYHQIHRDFIDVNEKICQLRPVEDSLTRQEKKRPKRSVRRSPAK